MVCCSWLSAVFESVYNTVLPAGLNMCLDCELVGLNDIHLQAAALGLTQDFTLLTTPLFSGQSFQTQSQGQFLSSANIHLNKFS